MDQQVFEEQLDEDYEPTPKEIDDYAKWLGLDPATDSHLLWIAREGLKAPLPDEWKPCRSPEQGLYYYNFVTGQSSWEHPSDSYYKNLFQEEKRKRAQPAQAATVPAQQQQLFAGKAAGRMVNTGSIFAGATAIQGFAGPVAAPFGAGTGPTSVPSTRPGTAQQHASWDSHWQSGHQQTLASNSLGRQLSAGGRLGPTGGAASAVSSKAPSPRRVSESASFAARTSAQASRPFEDVRKPGTAPAGGAKKVTWQDLVSTDPQPTAVVPKPRPALLAMTTPSPSPFPLASQRPGGMASSMEGSMPAASVPGSRSGVSSYAQQMQVYRSKLAAAAAAATGTPESLDGGSSIEAASGGVDIPPTRGEGPVVQSVGSKPAHESSQDDSGLAAGPATSGSTPEVQMEAGAGPGRTSSPEPSAATVPQLTRACRELLMGGASHSQQSEVEQPGSSNPSCSSLPGEQTDSSLGASLAERESSAAVSVQSGSQAELKDCSLHCVEPGSGVHSRQASTASLGQASSECECAAEGQPLLGPGRPQAAGDWWGGGEKGQRSSSRLPGSSESMLGGSSGGITGVEHQALRDQRIGVAVSGNGSSLARPRADDSSEEADPESSGPGRLDLIAGSQPNGSSTGQTPHGSAMCVAPQARRAEHAKAPAGDHPAAAAAVNAAALPGSACEERGQQGLVQCAEGCHEKPLGQAGEGEAELHTQPGAGSDEADMLECRLAAAATAAATKAHTALLREQALRQKQEATETRLKVQLKLDARHMDAIGQSLRSMKENVRQIHQLEHQGQQLSKAVAVQHDSNAYLTDTLTAADRACPIAVVSGPGATGVEACDRAMEPAGRRYAHTAAEEKQSESDLDGRMEQCLQRLQHALLDLTGQ